MDTFDIYFIGEMAPGADPAKVRAGVAALFKIQPEAAGRLFSGKPLRVKQGIDVDTASRYRAAFRDVGALVQIVPHGAPAPAQRPASEATTVPSGAAPAAQSAAPDADHAENPESSGTAVDDEAFTLAEPGATIDLTPPPSPVEINTEGLEALPANSGSLEDCRIEKPARPIPDISHLQLLDD